MSTVIYWVFLVINYYGRHTSEIRRLRPIEVSRHLKCQYNEKLYSFQCHSSYRALTYSSEYSNLEYVFLA